MLKMKPFNEIPIGGLFSFSCSPYIKISLTMAIPVIAYRPGLHKRRFKKAGLVALPKSVKYRSKDGAKCDVDW